MTNFHNGKTTNKTAKTMDQPTLTTNGALWWNSFSENFKQINVSVMMLKMSSQAWAPIRLVSLSAMYWQTSLAPGKANKNKRIKRQVLTGCSGGTHKRYFKQKQLSSHCKNYTQISMRYIGNSLDISSLSFFTANLPQSTKELYQNNSLVCLLLSIHNVSIHVV